jgi:type II secretory pathway component PulF
LRWVVRGGVLPPRALLAVGAGFVWGFFFLNWVGSTLLPWPAVVIGSVLALTTLTAVLVLPEIDRGHSPYGRTLLAVGLLSFLLFFAAVVTVSGDWGAPLALIGVAGIIVYLLRATGAAATPTAGLPTVP